MKESKKDERQEIPFVPNILASPHLRRSLTDPLGSYTGVPEEKGEVPVQDVDDL